MPQISKRPERVRVFHSKPVKTPDTRLEMFCALKARSPVQFVYLANLNPHVAFWGKSTCA